MEHKRVLSTIHGGEIKLSKTSFESLLDSYDRQKEALEDANVLINSLTSETDKTVYFIEIKEVPKYYRDGSPKYFMSKRLFINDVEYPFSAYQKAKNTVEDREKTIKEKEEVIKKKESEIKRLETSIKEHINLHDSALENVKKLKRKIESIKELHKKEYKSLYIKFCAIFSIAYIITTFIIQNKHLWNN